MEPTAAPWASARLRQPQSGLGLASAHAPRGPTAPVTLASAWPVATDGQQQQDWAPASKRITSQEDLTRFLRSEAAKSFVGFVLFINGAVKDTPVSAEVAVSPAVEALTAAIDSLVELLEEIPPAQHALRYGNPAFRTWFSAMAARAHGTLSSVLPPDLQGALPELIPYWSDSFGNATRIDYGTGHETCFAAFLYCLAVLGVLQPGDAPALGLRVFERYLHLLRRVQTTYWLEPAGSHGVWGLDDYQCLPFLWGSSQLAEHPAFTPAAIHKEAVLREAAPDYLYLAAIAFIKQVKKGPLAEVSPMLNDISGLESWRKVNSGMIKLYQAEVLSKVPIMQHFLFGSLLPFPDGPSS